MKCETNNPNRRTLRLKDYNYSKTGMYFITICTKDRKCVLSEIQNGEIKLKEYGKIVEEEILKTENIRKNIGIQTYVIMPNHIHLIIEIKDVGAAWYAAQKNKNSRKSDMLIPKIIQQLKTVTIKKCREINEKERVAYHATPTMAKKLLRACYT